jgi:hypothetical protein
MIKGKDIIVVGRHGILKLAVIAKNIAVEMASKISFTSILHWCDRISKFKRTELKE